MLQLNRNGLVLHGQLDVLRERFMTNQCVVLEKLLEPVLLEKSSTTNRAGTVALHNL